MARGAKAHAPVIAWDEIRLHLEFSPRQLAIIILFAEAQRKRTRIKRSGIRIPIRGV